jgi:hypothetical protein
MPFLRYRLILSPIGAIDATMNLPDVIVEWIIDDLPLAKYTLTDVKGWKSGLLDISFDKEETDLWVNSVFRYNMVLESQRWE